MIKLSVDMLGADKPETELAAGAINFLKKTYDIFLYVFGHVSELEPLFSAHLEINGKYEIVDSEDALTNYSDPMLAYTDENASLVKAMKYAKDGLSEGVVTLGATGAVLVCSIMILGKIKGLRPILAVELKAENDKPLLIVDCGANIDSRAELYVSFAKLGDAYMKCLGIANPRIALLSNGAEKTKGNEAVKAAHKLLEATPVNFIGNVEATGALDGSQDVIVADGFSGNVLLKSIEGVAKTVIAEIEQKVQNSSEFKEVLAAVKKKYDYNTQGGAMLLGVNKPVMKGHGSATHEAIENMLLRLSDLAKNGFIEKVRSSLEK